MKNLLVKMSGIGALLICLPVMYRIHQGDSFNPASYFLWSLLTLVCTVTLIRSKKGGHTMMIGYFFSDISIGIYAYVKSGRASFGQFEWFVIGLTLICICVYVACELRKSFRPAVIVNATACMIAGLPLLVDSIRNPTQMSLVICWLYILVSVFGYYGERTFDGKLIPGLSIIYWIVIIGGIMIAR